MGITPPDCAPKNVIIPSIITKSQAVLQLACGTIAKKIALPKEIEANTFRTLVFVPRYVRLKIKSAAKPFIKTLEQTNCQL